MARENQLWMGMLMPYMNSNFIRIAFMQMGENVLGVKMMTDKSGKPDDYCFVQFPDTYSALLALHRLHDKKGIPGSHPPVKFHLSHASLAGKHAMKNNYSLRIGNLSLDVDDCTLFKRFFKRYPSVRRAQVSMNEFGMSRGYGFVRFAVEEEQQKALIEMEGFQGIGKMFLHVNLVVDIETSQERNKSIPLKENIAAVQATRSGQTQATTSASTTYQGHSHYYKQSGNYYASSAQWSNYRNYYDPRYPSYNHALVKRTTQQSRMMPAAYRGAAFPAPVGMQMVQSSQQIRQQQPIPQQLSMRPADDNQAAAYPMGIRMPQRRTAEDGYQQQNDDTDFSKMMVLFERMGSK